MFLQHFLLGVSSRLNTPRRPGAQLLQGRHSWSFSLEELDPATVSREADIWPRKLTVATKSAIGNTIGKYIINGKSNQQLEK